MDLIARRRALMARKPARLPAEYQEVEYLESQGAQKIRTNVKRKSGLRAKYKILFTDHISETQQVFATNSPANSPILYFPYISWGKWYYGYNGAVNTNATVSVNTVYEVDSTLAVGNQTVTVDGNIIASGSDTFRINTTDTMSLFANDNESVPRYAYARIYYFDVFDTVSDTQIAKFVPCYRKADNKPGMYDLITDSFLVNYNTGADFTVGPDIN